MQQNYHEIVSQQRQYFDEKQTIPYSFRIEQLKKLLSLIISYEKRIEDALFKDLHKSQFEAWGTEVGAVINELNYYIRNLKKWMQPARIKTPLFHFRSKSFIQPMPYGNTLIISAWNYPFLLIMRPLMGALAAGNTAIVKPSENAPATAEVIAEIINNHFEKKYLYAVITNTEGAQLLIQQKYNYIFYTGGEKVGKLIYQEAAKTLTPVTLELGGKNPCIIDESANLDVTAARITWGKFTNSGQTCVAPDYLLVHENCKTILVEKIIENIKSSYGNEPQKSADYARIINKQHHQRIRELIDPKNILFGGNFDITDNYIAPTLVDVKNHKTDPVMQQEIFGPVLPVITYKHIDEALQIIQQHPNPLALYVFSTNKALIKKLATEIPSGDMAINEIVLHFGQLMMPVGGIGSSGIGKSQGRSTFETFSHHKSIMDKKYFPDLAIRYPPYSNKKLSYLKLLYRLLFTK